MTISYWIVCIAATGTGLVLLARLTMGRGQIAPGQRWRQQLTSREATYGKIALILLVSGLGLTLFGIVLELLVEG